MRTIEQQVREIQRLEKAHLARRKAREFALLVGASGGICLTLIIALANYLPSFQWQAMPQNTLPYAAALTDSPLVGFAVIILLSFLLGVCATLLCMQLRKREKGKRGK